MSSLPQLLLESVLISVLVSIILWAIRRVAHAAAEDAQRAPRAPMKLHFSKEWLRRRLETDPEEPGVMACDPQFLTPPSHQHFTFAGIADPSLEEAEALAQDVVDATDDLTVQAAHLRACPSCAPPSFASRRSRLRGFVPRTPRSRPRTLNRFRTDLA